MFIRVQRATVLWIVMALVCATATPGAAAAEGVLVVPLTGPPGDAAYRQAALDAIQDAGSSIEVLLSSVSLADNPLVPALAEAAGRGVAVRALLDASDWESDITERNRPTLSYLLEHGVAARFDSPGITLHAKLLVVDRERVIVGSSNWNRYAFSEHWQADVLVRDPQIGAFYGGYFDALWNETSENAVMAFEIPAGFGAEPSIVPIADLPESAAYARVLLALLRCAKRSIHVSMYRMSYYSGYGDSLANEILEALIAAARRGLEVQVLLDDCAFYAESASANLVSALLLHERGVEVRLDAPETTTHAKLVIVDGRTVLLGSTNWNYYALEQNYETDVAFVNLPEVADPYETYFRTLWDLGRDLAS
jgi:phosphatidylserine/phosphatidylglycerophosphate/cardiolipin synthase-like enzyme